MNSFYMKFKIVGKEKERGRAYLLISFKYKAAGTRISEQTEIRSFRYENLDCIDSLLSSFRSCGSVSFFEISEEKKEALAHIVPASPDDLRDGFIGFIEKFSGLEYFRDDVFVSEKLNLKKTSYLMNSVVDRGPGTNHRIRFGTSDPMDEDTLKKGLIHKYKDGFHCTLSIDDGYLFYVVKKVCGIQFSEISVYSMHGKKKGSSSFPLYKMRGEIKWAKLIAHN